MSLSSNDIYGPRGLGALYIRKGVQVAPVLLGGGQERGLRSGTEDLACIAGMAAAADIMAAEHAGRGGAHRAPSATASSSACSPRSPTRTSTAHPDRSGACPTTPTSASTASRARP